MSSGFGFELVVCVSVFKNNGDGLFVELVVYSQYAGHVVLVVVEVEVWVCSVASSVEMVGSFSKSLHNLLDASLLLVAACCFFPAVDGVVNEALCGLIWIGVRFAR